MFCIYQKPLIWNYYFKIMWIKITEMFISRREWNVLVRIFSLYLFSLACLKFHLLTFILCSLEKRVEWLMPQWNVRIWVVSIYIKLWNKIISSLFVLYILLRLLFPLLHLWYFLWYYLYYIDKYSLFWLEIFRLYFRMTNVPS